MVGLERMSESRVGTFEKTLASSGHFPTALFSRKNEREKEWKQVTEVLCQPGREVRTS